MVIIGLYSALIVCKSYGGMSIRVSTLLLPLHSMHAFFPIPAYSTPKPAAHHALLQVHHALPGKPAPDCPWRRPHMLPVRPALSRALQRLRPIQPVPDMKKGTPARETRTVGCSKPAPATKYKAHRFSGPTGPCLRRPCPGHIPCPPVRPRHSPPLTPLAP